MIRSQKCGDVGWVHFDDLTGKVAMCLSMASGAGFFCRSFDQAEDGALFFVYPELMILDTMSFLHCEILQMSSLDLISLYTTRHSFMKIHVEGHNKRGLGL
jgi:hypothetical protein